jgi:hypothetical protein
MLAEVRDQHRDVPEPSAAGPELRHNNGVGYGGPRLSIEPSRFAGRGQLMSIQAEKLCSFDSKV